MTLEARRMAETRLGRFGLITLGPIVTILAVSGSDFVIAGANHIEAYGAYFITPLTREFTLLEVLHKATPILFTGTAVAIAFRAGDWTIGGEGQLLLGAVAAAGIGQVVDGWSPFVVLPLMVGAGALAGALWALVPALLRVKMGIDEVVTTLLLNPVALLLVQGLLHGPWKDPETGFPESPRIAAAAEFPQLSEILPFIGRSRLHLGFVIAVVLIVVAWYVLSRTSTGLRVRAVGLSPHGARFAGIKVERTLLRVALISGAVAGIAGVSEVAVIGVPDEKWGEVPIATVVLMPGIALTAEELIDWTNSRVDAKFQRIRDVVIMESFPRNVAGKMLKREMRAAYRARR